MLLQHTAYDADQSGTVQSSTPIFEKDKEDGMGGEEALVVLLCNIQYNTCVLTVYGTDGSPYWLYRVLVMLRLLCILVSRYLPAHT